MSYLSRFFRKKDEAKKQAANSKPTCVNIGTDSFAYFKVVVPKHSGICGAEINFFKMPVMAINTNYHECETYSTSRPKKELVFLHTSQKLKVIPITKEYYDQKYRQLTNK